MIAIVCSTQCEAAVTSRFLCADALPQRIASVIAGTKGGRRIAPAGQKDMDLIAGRVECILPSYGL